MASSTESTSSSSPQSIVVHVVSPNSEVPGRLTFPDVLASETIADLKRRIQQAVPSKPTLERQRIIYRGRALIQHDLTLQTVLGNEISNASNPFVFHLVLSPLDSTNPPNVARTDGLHQPTGLPAPPMNNFGMGGLNIPQRPASTSQVPEGGQQQQFPHTHGMPFNPLLGMLPQGLQPGQNVDIRMQFTQTGRPFNHGHMPPGVHMQAGNLPFPMPGAGMTPFGMLDPQFGIVPQQIQQMHHQAHHDMVNRANNQPWETNHSQAHSQSASRRHSRNPSAGREMSDNPTQASQSQRIPTPPPTFNGPPRSPRQPTARPFSPSSIPGLGSMAAANLHAMRQNHLQNMQLDQINQFTQLRNALLNPLQSPRPSVSAPSTQTVYLLSSPRGPEALLLSPNGNFTTGASGIGIGSPGLNPVLGSLSVVNNQNHQPAIPAPVPGQVVAPAPAQAPAQIQVQQPQQQQDQAGDLLRILLPLGGPIWLLIRLAGFIYLFAGGRGWRNTILLGIFALIGFLAQTGVFNPLIRNVWRPIREHVETIINPQQLQVPSAEGQEQTPEQMANRLIRRQANENPIRRIARRAERSILLFGASLIPGVGEGHVRAHEAAERQQREAAEAAERARLEAEQQAHEAEAHESEEKQTEAVVDQTDIQEPSSDKAEAEQAGVD